jgi:chemotaxis protein MotB
MQNLAWLIERHHFRVIIDGHTRSQMQYPTDNYTAWELSADRANAARRCLVHYAVDPGSIERVTGYADTRPVDGEPPESESNQRITLSLSLSQNAAAPKAAAEATVPAAKTEPVHAAIPNVSFNPPAS